LGGRELTITNANAETFGVVSDFDNPRPCITEWVLFHTYKILLMAEQTPVGMEFEQFKLLIKSTIRAVELLKEKGIKAKKVKLSPGDGNNDTIDALKIFCNDIKVECKSLHDLGFIPLFVEASWDVSQERVDEINRQAEEYKRMQAKITAEAKELANKAYYPFEGVVEVPGSSNGKWCFVRIKRMRGDCNFWQRLVGQGVFCYRSRVPADFKKKNGAKLYCAITISDRGPQINRAQFLS
jgi:hypothetical protein